MSEYKTVIKKKIAEWRTNIQLFAYDNFNFVADDWQLEAFHRIEKKEIKRLSIKSGQGVGKTAFSAIVFLWFLTCYQNSRVVATAPTRQQLNDVLWAELEKWRQQSPFLKRLLKWTKTYIYVVGREKRWFGVARASSKPENMQGFHEDNMLFIIDEASGVPDEVLEAVRGTLSGVNNKLLLVGNPTKTSGMFYDSHTTERANWSTMTVDSSLSKRTDKENIQSLINKYGAESNVVRVRVHGLFPLAEDDVFIPITMLEKSIATDIEVNEIPTIIDIGCDVARFGDDKTVIGYRTDGVVRFYKKRHGQDTMATANDVLMLGNILRLKYPKEFGDPRIMDMRNGEYVNSVADLENENYAANEIYEYKFNSKPYGDVRWIGCMYPIVGSSFAEALNLNYFENGRHTPLAICIENGRLSDKAAKKLAEYTQSIKGEKGQHAFLLIETEPIKSDMVWNKENPPKITIKDMANVLQKDELFGEYLDNARRKVQSSFNLPDIYVGYTTDFNRATAYAAMTVTEQQVFQPYRDNLAWDINNKLLNIYNFKYVEAYFETPDFNNPDDIKTVFDAVGPYGGISANFAKEIGYKQLGKDCNDYDFDGADLPYEMSLNNANTISQQLEGQIAKAEQNGDADIVPILKSLLVEFKKIRHSSGEKDGQ